MDNNEFVLNIEDISYIVNALEVYTAFERHLAITEDRGFDTAMQSTLTYLREIENTLERNDVKYAKLSYSI